ncbi:MAG: TIGR01777 family oxidoreductase [Psychromonas sp.]
MSKGKVLITGSTGLIGSALIPLLESHGYQVAGLSRDPNSDQPSWDIKNKSLSLKEFENPDIVIHLAGESIADGRWNDAKKKRLVDSRVLSTQLLVDHFNKALPPVKLFICASAIGFYGNRGNQQLDEDSPPGNDFVSELAEQWEKSSQPIKESGTRLVNIRTGLVISKKGGALAKMLPPFKLGLGGRIGSGEQMMSWIDINDMTAAILFIINNQSIEGAVNMVSPNPINNQHFSKALANQLQRPCILPLPELMVKLMFAEMGKELLLSSTLVLPKKLIDSGFEFKCKNIEQSFSEQLSKA